MSAAPFAPLPWHCVPWHVEEGPAAVRCVEGWVVCHTSSDNDAEFIARAANCHGELLEALEGLASAVNTRSLRGRDHIPSMREEQGAMAFARAAIAKALGRTPNEIGDEG